MNLEKIEIEGFKSFKEKQTFCFGDKKGVYFLLGVNNVDKTLGSNGAGKSSVWDALCWVLYGRTVKGLKAGELLNWHFGAKGSFSVKLFWESNGRSRTLLRTWNPNRLELTTDGSEPDTVSQEKVDDVFGITYAPFLSSVLMGQGRPMFFDLKESSKASLFSDIFALDKWISLSDAALSDSKDLGVTLAQVDAALAANKAERRSLGKELLNYKELKTGWSKAKSVRVKKARTKLSEISSEIESEGALLRKCNRDKVQTQTDILSVSEEIKRVGEIIYRMEDRITTVNEDMVHRKSHVKIKKEDEEYFRKYSKGGAYPCTLCGQPISRRHATTQIVRIREEVRKLGFEYHDKIVEKKRWKERLEEAQQEFEGLQKELRILNGDMGVIASDISFVSGTLSVLRKEESSCRDALASIKDESNPFAAAIRGVHTSTFYSALAYKKLIKTREAISSKKEDTFFWVKGFKDVRLYLISEFLLQLEIEVASALAKLGLPDWKVSFAVEKETKSKTIRKGFQVMIHSPINRLPVAWELWSGGESQRLRIAGNMGLSTLVLSQFGITPNLEIWDEPSQHLGKEGVSDMLETIYDRAQQTNKCIWIVEHNNLEFGGFEGAVTVTKTHNGSILN